MKKSNIRILSFILALLMILQVSPIAFAVGTEEETTEIEETAPEITVEEVIEEDAEEAPEASDEEALPEEELSEEELSEEEPSEAEAEEVPEEVSEGIEVRFVFEAEYTLTLKKDDQIIDPKSADAAEVTYLLAPGSYSYSAQMRGHIGTAEGTVEVTEDMEAITIAPELEKYPFGLPGLALDAAPSLIGADVKKALKENMLSSNVASVSEGKGYVKDRLIFSAENAKDAQLIAEAYGAELVNFEYGMGIMKLDGISVADAVEASLNEELLLPAVEPDFIITLDDPVCKDVPGEVSADYSTIPGTNSWYTWYNVVGSGNQDTFLKNPSSNDYPYMLDRMNVYKAWGLVTGNSSVRVAVIDTGLQTSHIEFKNRVGTKGYDSTYFSSVNDDQGHGTHCAGIIAAAMGNGAGMAGIAPGVTLYPYKALNANGSGATSSIIKGINWAIDTARVDIISMSLSGPFPDYYEELAIRRAVDAGITVVVSMGNEGSNMKCYPAGFNIPGMIVVGATDAANATASYSNTGSWCDIMAPGTRILSTDYKNTNGYQYKSGTSMATPAVAGACALFMSKFGHRTVLPTDMEKMVKAAKTNGVLDVYKLVAKKYTPKNLSWSLAAGEEDVTAKYDASERLPQNLSIALNSEDKIIFTLDGTIPGCLNGEIANGEVYKKAIKLTDFEIGEQVQLKAVTVSEDGDTGNVMSLNFMVVDPIKEAPEDIPEITDGEDPKNYSPLSNKIYVGFGGGTYEYYTKAYNYNAGLYPMTSATLYSTPSPNYNYQYYVTVEVKNDYGYSVPFVLSTTSKIVEVYNNTVYAVPGKTGNATIKVTALDGSKKTTSFKVKLINPASRIDISTKSVKMGDNMNYTLAVGKSATHKAVLGNAYGTPSIKKVEWRATLYREGNYVPNYGYFSISSSGKLTIKKAMSNLVNYDYGYFIEVYACTTDGTNLMSNVICYNITTPTSFIGFPGSNGYLNVYSDWYYPTVKTTYYLSNNPDYNVATVNFWVKANYYNSYTVTSSNPNVATVTYSSENGTPLHTSDGDDLITIYLIKRGTTTITVKANDGSGKTAKLKITVK